MVVHLPGGLELPVFHSFIAVVATGGANREIVVSHAVLVKRWGPSIRSTFL